MSEDRKYSGSSYYLIKILHSSQSHWPKTRRKALAYACTWIWLNILAIIVKLTGGSLPARYFLFKPQSAVILQFQYRTTSGNGNRKLVATYFCGCQCFRWNFPSPWRIQSGTGGISLSWSGKRCEGMCKCSPRNFISPVSSMLQNKSMGISKNENKQTGPAATYLFLCTHTHKPKCSLFTFFGTTFGAKLPALLCLFCRDKLR